MPSKIALIAGARPNFMKLAPVLRTLTEKGADTIVIHTGQHYDYNMSEIFFDELGIPSPDVHLGVGSDSHARQTAKVMIQFEELCIAERPSLVVVFGDVNSTVACALVAAKMSIPVAHVESGLRSFDREMPEEINRIVTDHLSSWLFTTTELASQNLVNEGIQENKISLVGNVMIDTLIHQTPKINESKVLKLLGLEKSNYDVLTLHRPSNVDDPDKFSTILGKLSAIENRRKIVFPAHPRTLSKIEEFGLRGELMNMEIIQPLGYHDFSHLLKHSNSVWTDSGGIQEECTHYKIRCFTLRENTERPETIDSGSNRLVSLDDDFSQHYNRSISDSIADIPLWDGNAAERIADYILENM